MDTRPGRLTRVVGTLTAVAGPIIILSNYNSPSYEFGYFIGALLFLGGLLLRIEVAILARGNADG